MARQEPKKQRVRRRRRPAARLDPAWARACEEVVAATAADLVRFELRPVAEMIVPAHVRKVARSVAEQVRLTRYFVRRDVRAAMRTLQAQPELPPGYDPKLRLHYALIGAAAHRAWETGQVPDPTVAFMSMKESLERYFQGRS